MCDSRMPSARETTGPTASFSDETRVRAATPNADFFIRGAMAGCAKDLPSFDRGNGAAPNCGPELRG
jgi:hypothetical protein